MSTISLRLIGQFAIGAAAFFSSWAAHVPLGLKFTPVFLPIVAAFLISVVCAIQQKRLYLLPVDVWFIFFLVVLLLSATVSLNPETGMQTWRLWLLSFFGYSATRLLFQSYRSVQILAWAAVLGAFATFLTLAPTVDDWGNLGRAAVHGINTNYTAYVICGYIFIYLLHISGYEASRMRLIFDFAVIGFMLYILATLETRGALISAVAMIAYWLVGFRIPTWMVSLGLIALAIWSILFSLGYLDFILVVLDAASGDRSTGDLAGRGTIWEDAQRTLAQNWLLGVGPGQYLIASERGVGAHNFFLSVGLDVGIIGLCVMLGFIATFGRMIFRSRIGPQRLNPAILFFSYWAPIALSGHWEIVTFSWIVVAFTLQRVMIQDAQIIQRTSVS